MSIKNVITITLSLLCLNCFSKDRSFFAVPAFFHIPGMGYIYGIGAGGKNLWNKNVDIVVGKSFGKVDSFGGTVRRVPVYFENVLFSYSRVQAKELELETSYARGLSEKSVVRQRMEADIDIVQFDLSFFKKRLNLSTGIQLSTAEFVGFDDEDGNTIPFSRDDLFPVKMQTYFIGVKALVVKDLKHLKKLDISLKVSDQTGRKGQSDTRIYDYIVNSDILLSKNTTLGLLYKGSKAQILKKYITGENEISGNCSSISDASTRSKCLKLEDDLSKYVVDSNHIGTASPIGGAFGARAYRQFRFRAKYVNLAAVELKFLVSKKYRLEFVPFAEFVFANDNRDKVFNRSRYSSGLSIRGTFKSLPIRIDGATGEEGSQWVFLTGINY